MKKLSEYKDEEALDVLADLIDPVLNIFSDKEVADWYRKGVIIKSVQVAIKNHKTDVMNMLTTLNRGEYHCTLISLPKDLFEVFNDKELKDFFVSQEQIISETLSGSPTESIEEDTDTSSNT